MRFNCIECGQEHDLEDISFSASEPDQWAMLSPADRAHSQLNRDSCIIRSEGEVAYFVAGALEIPIMGTKSSYTWGVWASVSERSFTEMQEHWFDPEREKFGPYFGWLCTVLPNHPDTMFQKTQVHQRAVGIRPRLELEPTEHPLAIQQRRGISRGELIPLLQRLLHHYQEVSSVR
jgi:hypothetical protein